MYKKCMCGTICGFLLSDEIIAEDNEYTCSDCGVEMKLSKWIKSDEGEYNSQIKMRNGSKYYRR
jgi:hypothetical protein